jgi:Alcohol dehydrogenase GroES-like domain
MKAIVQGRYGSPKDVLRLEDVGTPQVNDDEVRVRVRAAAVNPADWHLVRGEPYIARLQWGLRTPKNPVPGCDLTGQVEAVGRNVTRLQAGDEVFGSSFMRGFGALAESASVPEDVLATKPANLSFGDAAAVAVDDRAHRGGRCLTGDRPEVLPGGGPGSDPVPGGRTRSRKGRDRRLTPGRRQGSSTYCARKVRADSVSSRYTTLVERQTASPVIVIAAMICELPRKLGPPESP